MGTHTFHQDSQKSHGSTDLGLISSLIQGRCKRRLNFAQRQVDRNNNYNVMATTIGCSEEKKVKVK